MRYSLHLLKFTLNKHLVPIRNLLLELTLVGFTVDIDQIGSSSHTFVRPLEIVDEPIEIPLFRYCVTVEKELNLSMNIVFDELIDDLKILRLCVNKVRFEPIINNVYQYFQFLSDSRWFIELFSSCNLIGSSNRTAVSMPDNNSVFGIRLFESVKKITVYNSFTIYYTNRFISYITWFKQEIYPKRTKKHAFLGDS